MGCFHWSHSYFRVLLTCCQSHLSLQLLCKLQEAHDHVGWDRGPDLLAWLLYIGGAFAPAGAIRSDYMALLRLHQGTRLWGLYTSWPDLLQILERFIWSEKVFLSQVKAFWEESWVNTKSTEDRIEAA